MDITPTNTNAANANTANAKSPETESPDHQTGTTRIQSAKHLTFTNGVLKRHQPHHQLRHHHHHHHHPIVITYKECLKNHAASLGGHALDGCGEFMPSPTATATDPTSLKCAACGCHRNFHRREPEDISHTASLSNPTNANTTATIEYQPHHRHHPPPPPPAQQPQPPASQRSPNSSSPPPISSSYYPSAPHMLLALSGNLQSAQETMISNLNVNVSSNSSARKRFRTKFSQSQKEKMFQFAERVGWKMQKRDDETVQEFCNEVGVDRTVLKVWMHNNKNTLAKRDLNGSSGGGGGGGGGGGINLDNHSNEENNDNDDNKINKSGSEDHEENNNTTTVQNLNHHFEGESVAHVATANGSSSSS